MSEWISVEDKLPDSDEDVMVLFGGVVCIGRCSEGSWLVKPIINPYSAYKHVTHWAEIPK